MGFHLVIFAQHSPPEPKDEELVKHIKPVSSRFAMRRCAKPGALYDVVLDAVRAERAPVRVLDLYDHGGPGIMTMGDPLSEALFDSTSTGHAVATKLAELMTFNAHVRLLGCNTASGHAGKALLVNLQKAFGKSIVVFGSIDKVDPDFSDDFDEGGLLPTSEEGLLFSSTEASQLSDGQLPPSYDDLVDRRAEWAARFLQ